MIEWIASHDVGTSSRTMWAALMGVSAGDCHDVPCDSDDFSRCYDLYTFCEVTSEDLQKIVDVYPYWRPVIGRWTELCELFEAEKHYEIYTLLSSMRDEIMLMRGYRKMREGYWLRDSK